MRDRVHVSQYFHVAYVGSHCNYCAKLNLGVQRVSQLKPLCLLGSFGLPMLAPCCASAWCSQGLIDKVAKEAQQYKEILWMLQSWIIWYAVWKCPPGDSRVWPCDLFCDPEFEVGKVAECFWTSPEDSRSIQQSVQHSVQIDFSLQVSSVKHQLAGKVKLLSVAELLEGRFDISHHFSEVLWSQWSHDICIYILYIYIFAMHGCWMHDAVSFLK